MGIRSIFNTTWEQAVLRAASYRDIEVVPDQRIVIDPVTIMGVKIAEVVVMFGPSVNPTIVAVRYTNPAIALAAYLHNKEQAHRLRKAGINGQVTYEEGIIECTYANAAWLVDLYASSVSCKSKPSQQTTSETISEKE